MPRLACTCSENTCYRIGRDRSGMDFGYGSKMKFEDGSGIEFRDASGMDFVNVPGVL